MLGGVFTLYYLSRANSMHTFERQNYFISAFTVQLEHNNEFINEME